MDRLRPTSRSLLGHLPRRGLATQQTTGEQDKPAGEREKPAHEAQPSSAEDDACANEASPEELLQKELDDLQEKIKTEKHSLLLALADFENNKKRYMTARASRKGIATVNFATRLIEVYDQFDELAHSEAKAENRSEACQALQEGISLTRDLYRTTLERFDVHELRAEAGDPMVATRHESLGCVEDSNLSANAVAELVKPGWVLEPTSAKPTVMRKAQVKVARHGPKTPPSP